MGEQVDDHDEPCPEGLELVLPDGASNSALHVVDDIVREAHDLLSPLGGDNEFGASIHGLCFPLDVPESLKLVDDSHDDLLVSARSPRQFGGACSRLVEMRDDGPVEPRDFTVSGCSKSLVQLVLHGEQEPGGQGSQTWLPASGGGSRSTHSPESIVCVIVIYCDDHTNYLQEFGHGWVRDSTVCF